MDASIQAVESAVMPVLPQLACQMVAEIDRGESYGTMFKTFQAMVDDMLQGLEPGPLKTSLEKTQRYEKDFLVLFHTISRPVLRSLLMGRLASDLWKPESDNWAHVYNDKGAGTYALAMHIEGRRGNWLTRNEIERVRGHLKSYLQASTLFETCMADQNSFNNNQLDFDEELVMQIAMKIDNKYASRGKEWAPDLDMDDNVSVMTTQTTQTDVAFGKLITDYQAPRFGSASKIKKNTHIIDLISMLKRRCRSEFDGNIQQKSVPLQIGCSKKIDHRVQDHNPTIATLDGSSKSWGLLTSIVAYMGLRPKLVSVPVVRVWRLEDVGLSEILVHVLAGSFSIERGLNVHPPGKGQSYEKRQAEIKRDGEVHVWCDKSWFKKNLMMTLGASDPDDMASLTAKVKHLLDREVLEKFEKTQADVVKSRRKWKEARTSVMDKLQQLKDQRKEVDHFEQIYGKMLHLESSNDNDSANQ